MRRAEIAAWTPEWGSLYAAAQEELKQLLGKDCIEIHHIGSTSVPAIGYAKPIIDIVVAVRSIQAVDAFNERMIEAGFQPRGENGIAGRRYFTKGGERRTHHIHIFEAGDVNILAHLDFKAYLTAHPDEARRYGELKLRLAEQYPDHVHRYQEGKQFFVQQLAQKAAEWAARSDR
ncbi:GrpB family protein [Paenibacillus sp. H1-7]|uniref:GrpB family protein n=1 Tax=Paenibacillus sp. H1-7 TaxID=2282849 RepID=UPI001EF7F280|nr:GrpB family protein [Paenibacillus sp. H1-7]ULL17548.1 GrpB family protein [Paenibacillus sp. H1-7]